MEMSFNEKKWRKETSYDSEMKNNALANFEDVRNVKI